MAGSWDKEVTDYDRLTRNHQIIIGKPDDLEKDLHIHAKVGWTITAKVFDGTTDYNVDFEVGVYPIKVKLVIMGTKLIC